MDYRSPLARVRGLGSAKAGTAHWWMQRVTAVALIPLSFWLIIFLDLGLNAPYADTLAWLSSPLNTICHCGLDAGGFLSRCPGFASGD